MENAHTDSSAPSFANILLTHGLSLRRDKTETLQVNVGKLCNMACRHCHLEAGPDCSEVMSRDTMDEVISYARRTGFNAIDITGGAPEMVPGIDYLVDNLAPLASRVLFRTNLTALWDIRLDGLSQLLKKHRVVLVASLPSLHAGQAAAQRGTGSLEKSLEMLKVLNALGYGREGGDLLLHLVANPAGAFMPPAQRQQEMKFRHDLSRREGIVFNDLLTLANVPVGRFRRWLESSGNLDGYMDKLVSAFNPATVPNLMCRSQVSVNWDGYLYDCDFNLALGLGHGGENVHVSSMPAAPPAGAAVANGEHCFACTAGGGSSCGGALAA
ncbi:arsenosugar biosynthesis radical SAM (seleno)protein ArsS [Geomonas azotofigens]|uniref:arsenosugar biosynthesis radical SAM (seleno)protein ArsS n=1 Tax=Geomonas azotofigens TaxID=2843196 RepID=UPI001C0F677E|nr:arsenosugar biosynthesis radical SAM (seleno)protein ArsS [Geomonas azotofigens]MBU5613877.1 arsenosugar biosynthesis radical SAM protein ArsS [Geomonas azotofigens]